MPKILRTTQKECKMTVYENLKRKENILIGASRRAESQDMKSMWLAKALALRCKANEMTIEEAEKEIHGANLDR